MKNTNTRSTSANYRLPLILMLALIVVSALSASPFSSVRASFFSLGLSSHPSASNTRHVGLSSPLSRALTTNLTLSFSESITTYAGDCTTPKSTFVLGETVCAKTDNVDLAYPGGRWVDWIVTGSPNTIVSGSRTTTLITANPQTFTYVPTLAGVYKVEITQDDGSGGDNPQTPAVFTVNPPPETAAVYKADCTTPAGSFNLGDTLCAKVSGAPLDTRPQRRLSIENMRGYIAAEVDVTADPQTLMFTLPTTASSTYGIATIDNRGAWAATTSDAIDGVGIASTQFLVRDPAENVSDLAVTKTIKGSSQIPAGDNVNFSIFVYNYGPDPAANVSITDASPANTTFVAGIQESGPTFSCTNPSMGGTGTSTCTIASLNRGGVAEFTFVYKVNTGVAVGTEISNTVNVASDTFERDSADNSDEAKFFVTSNTGGGGSGTCSIGCADDVSTPANTTDGGGNPGAVVHFSPPTGNTECGTVNTNHCNDCFFPVGTTIVTATATTGDTCSFTVTVTASGLSISCPANQTANADASCQASVEVGTASASGGTNMSVIGTRNDGLAMYTCDVNGTNCTRNSSDAPFSAGTTTITWIVYSHDTPGPYADAADEESHRTGSASCTQTVVVNDVTPPVITATNQTVSADASCQAVVPDYSNSATDNCACASSDTSEICQDRDKIVVTQDVAAGSGVTLGTTTIHLTATDEANNTSTKTVTFTVVDTTPPTFTFVPAAITAYTGAGATTCDTVVNPGTATASDNCGPVTITRSPSGNTFSVGTTTITWTAKDGANNTTTATQTITVIDNTPPTITTNGQTPSMWPPDHSLHTFQVTDFVTSVFDNCGGVSVGDVVISQVTSDEVDDATGGGDGNTVNDIQIASNCKSVQLRSERSGNADGRVYTITFRLTDTHGNVTTATATVVVPHDQGAGPETVVDSGPHYTVNSSCP